MAVCCLLSHLTLLTYQQGERKFLKPSTKIVAPKYRDHGFVETVFKCCLYYNSTICKRVLVYRHKNNIERKHRHMKLPLSWRDLFTGLKDFELLISVNSLGLILYPGKLVKISTVS